MEEAVNRDNAATAWQAVKRNDGAAGIDRMTVSQAENHLRQHWEKIRAKLLEGTYTPSPVRRVEIPKPGGGMRQLGIPTVMDRFIQQMLLQAMQPIFEPHFSESSYGFRPGRRAHEAVKAAQQHTREGKDWVVDMDIAQFFDHVNHDLLLHEVGKVIRDKRVLRLIGKYLRSGAMVEGVVMANEEGTPQGGPLSPLLANIYLNPLDKELERRGLAFCRYADDCNIYVRSERAATRVLESVGSWIQEQLRLELNAAKSGVGRPWERKFLGFRIRKDLQIEAAPSSIKRFKNKVRELWQSCQGRSSEQLRDRWCAFVRGWWGYYRLAEDRHNIATCEGWIRRHMRSCFWQRWHSAQGRRRRLQQLGLRGRQLQVADSGRGAWHLAKAPALHMALSNQRLRSYGFWVPSDLAAMG